MNFFYQIDKDLSELKQKPHLIFNHNYDNEENWLYVIINNPIYLTDLPNQYKTNIFFKKLIQLANSLDDRISIFWEGVNFDLIPIELIDKKFLRFLIYYKKPNFYLTSRQQLSLSFVKMIIDEACDSFIYTKLSIFYDNIEELLNYHLQKFDDKSYYHGSSYIVDNFLNLFIDNFEILKNPQLCFKKITDILNSPFVDIYQLNNTDCYVNIIIFSTSVKQKTVIKFVKNYLNKEIETIDIKTLILFSKIYSNLNEFLTQIYPKLLSEKLFKNEFDIEQRKLIVILFNLIKDNIKSLENFKILNKVVHQLISKNIYILDILHLIKNQNNTEFYATIEKGIFDNLNKKSENNLKRNEIIHNFLTKEHDNINLNLFYDFLKNSLDGSFYKERKVLYNCLTNDDLINISKNIIQSPIDMKTSDKYHFIKNYHYYFNSDWLKTLFIKVYINKESFNFNEKEG